MKARSPRLPLIEVKDLSIHRGDRKILEGIDWSVLRGEHWVILGPNGSGKTSLLSALTGYLMPTAGEIRVLGETFGESDWRDLRLHIGIVSSVIRNNIQDSEIAIDAVISGKDAVINSWKHSSSLDRREARNILRLIECRHLEKQIWATLSQGERQRLLIGRALISRPKILILDEACAGLDPVARENFLQFLKRLIKTKSAPTLLFVTHHLEEIIPAFSHILMLRKGRTLAAGPIASCITSKNLGRMFETRITVSKRDRKYYLSVHPKKEFVA
jgi:iron complex transport system ATP-binding protein